LIRDLDSPYQDYLSTVDALDDRQFEEKCLDGQWCALEITAHIRGWMGLMTLALEQMARGEKPDLNGVEWTESDELNAQFAQRAHGKGQDEVIGELYHAIEAFKTAALRLPDEASRKGEQLPACSRSGASSTSGSTPGRSASGVIAKGSSRWEQRWT
jgi:hypothetical protein